MAKARGGGRGGRKGRTQKHSYRRRRPASAAPAPQHSSLVKKKMWRGAATTIHLQGDVRLGRAPARARARQRAVDHDAPAAGVRRHAAQDLGRGGHQDAAAGLRRGETFYYRKSRHFFIAHVSFQRLGGRKEAHRGKAGNMREHLVGASE